jgi:Bacterial low temperature requirement A protein (LtrA)
MDFFVPEDEEVHEKAGPHNDAVDAVDDDDGCDVSDNDYYGYDDVNHTIYTNNHDELANAENSSRSMMTQQIGKHGRRINVTAEIAPRDLSSFRPSRVLLYSPPRQRQKWGDTQVLPRVNWGDLFFDLFYVGATYNVSTILIESPSSRGFLYAAGTFLPVLNVWNQKTKFDARYVTESDVFHRVLTIVGLAIAGVTISNIRSVDILSDASNQSSIFVFTLMLVIESIYASFWYLEVYFCGIGQKQLKHASRRDGFNHNINFPFYLAAMIIAAVKYFGDAPNINYTFGKDMTNRRFIATTEVNALQSDGTTDIPIFLCLLGYVLHSFYNAFVIIFCVPGGGRHKET